MRRGGRVRAAAFVAAACVVGGVCVSAGRVWADDIWANDKAARVILFSGSDIWRNGIFAHGGLLWSPAGIDSEGFTLKAMLSGGRYRYNSGDLGSVQVTGTEMTAQLLPGWRFKGDHLEVKVFMGLDVQSHRLSPDDPSNQLHGHSVGMRVAADLWYEPTPTTMVAADGSLGSIVTSDSARLAYGWRMFEQFYVGPETQLFASDGYRQFRFGAHLTGLKTGSYEWSAAAGWAEDTSRRSSLYVRLGVLTRQ
jgi:Cellulose biosynthesis protein BcsS